MEENSADYKREVAYLYTAYRYDEEQRTLVYRVASQKEQIEVSTVQLVAMLFEKVKFILELNKCFKERATVSVTPNFESSQRKVLIQGAQIAGFKINLKDSQFAALLYYNFYRQLQLAENTERLIVLVDFGYSQINLSIT